MGIILDEVCCVDTNNFIDTDNYRSSPIKESRGKDSRPNIATLSDKFVSP